MKRQWRAMVAALALSGVLAGCVHTRVEGPVLYCMASRTDAAGSFYASEQYAGWSQFRGPLDGPFADVPYLAMHYTVRVRGSGDAPTLAEPRVSISFGRRFRERALPLHRGGVRQHFRAEARVTDEAISIGAARDGWAFFPVEQAANLLRNDGPLELTLYDSHGRVLHRETVSAEARVEISRTLIALAEEALVMAQDREKNCRLDN
ncbi:MAG: hypothetical protein JNM59_13065 [Hyphomonadaceae bacterium]|nr:hypothetical protein [Hyphomonadaceae bacterium]